MQGQVSMEDEAVLTCPIVDNSWIYSMHLQGHYHDAKTKNFEPTVQASIYENFHIIYVDYRYSNNDLQNLMLYLCSTSDSMVTIPKYGNLLVFSPLLNGY